MKVGFICLALYRTSSIRSSWNCLELGAKQLLPGQAVPTVCQPHYNSHLTANLKQQSLYFTDDEFVLLPYQEIEIRFFTTLNFMILVIPFLSFEGPEKTGEASTVSTISFEWPAPLVQRIRMSVSNKG
jgi:hypothetical protein